MLLFAVLAVSCTKNIEVKGKIANANPLARVEFIEASGVATLPLANLGVNDKGEFQGSFESPKTGMYLITYGNNMAMIFLKKGQSLDISGDAATFPSEYVITGDGKANNDFLKAADKGFEDYAKKIQMEALLNKKEPEFIKDFQKVEADLLKEVDKQAAKFSADSEAVNFKKLDMRAKLLGLLDAYEQNHGMMTGNASFKVSENFNKVKKELVKDENEMIREIPVYREYILGKLNGEFQQFATPKMQDPTKRPLMSEIFAEFLKTKKDLSPLAKDYLYAYVVAQSDINYNNVKDYDKITKLIEQNISDANVKKDVLNLQKVLMGHKEGTIPNLRLEDATGKKTNLSELKGKPTLVMFYASYSPNISMSTVPVVNEIANFYKSKMNFALVNIDDTQEQFKKTSSTMFKGFPGSNYWIQGGINSEDAKNFGLYAFKVPSFIILDKDGKMVGRQFYNLGEEEFVNTMDKVSGLKAPQVQTQMPPQMQMPVETPADSAHAK